MAKKVVSKETLERWQERVSLIQCIDFSLEANADIQKERIARARKDYEYFVETYFPHLAKSKCGKFQVDAAKWILANTRARAVFEWPRGHAKSTHISLLIPLWLKIQENRTINSMVLVSKSDESADELLSDLQAELQYNSLLIKDFGNQVVHGSWTTGKFRTTDGCFFVSIGRGQSPRGLKNRAFRPDYIVIDDIDDDEMARNQKRVKETFDWCLSALIGAMEMGRGRFMMVGNRIAKDCVLTRMIDRPSFHHVKINTYNNKGEISWKENYTRDEIEQLRSDMGSRRFEKEYMNNPITEGTIFKEKHIRWGKMLPLREYRQLICYTDPSFKSGTQNDYKATVLCGITSTGEFHIIKCFADQTTVDTMVNWHYHIDDVIIKGSVPVLYYMEANFLQDLLLDEFAKRGVEEGNHIPVVGDKRSKGDKFARIEAMQPLFERGLVVLNENEKTFPGMLVLIDQLLSFEKGSRSHDDAPDALESAIWMLSRGNRQTNSSYRCGERRSNKY